MNNYFSAASDFTKRNVVVFAIASFVLLLPIWLTAYPPLLDWPNHLARAYILAHYREVPQFQDAYTLYFGLLPNLGVDIMG
ncbi:MAG: hypothetical protein ACP5RN_15585, partial [Armatimonadota bacterium]